MRGFFYGKFIVLMNFDHLFVRKSSTGSPETVFLTFTAADHHVHHRTFVYNYGHTMMWWDRLVGTYKSPDEVSPGHFNHSRETQVQGGSSYLGSSKDTS